jgi:hypothetical protein
MIIGAVMVAALLLPATANATGPAETCPGRVCWAWRKQCVRYVYVFGRPVCTAWTFTCIQWL